MSHDPTPDQVATWLRTIPDLAALLPHSELTRATSEGPRPAPASKPPAKLHIIDLLDQREKTNWEHGMGIVPAGRQGLIPTLNGWICDLEAQLYDANITNLDVPPIDPTVAECCSWLHHHLDHIHTLDTWPTFADDIRQLHTQLRAATRGITDRNRPVPCQHCGAGQLQHTPGHQALWTCNACGHQVTVQAVTIQQAARILGRPERTIRAWANRSLITAISDGPRTNLYDLGDIRRVHAEVQLRNDAG